MTSSSSSRDSCPDYTEALYWRITEDRSRLLKITFTALPLAIVSSLGFGWMAGRYGQAAHLGWGTREGVIFVGGIFVVLAIHEMTHGILMRTFGAHPRFGFWTAGGMFYAKAPGHVFTRWNYLVIVLGPLTILSLLACGGILLLSGTPLVWFPALWAVVNASAANADVWITAVILRYPATACVVDEADGLRVLLPLRPAVFSSM